MLDTTQWGIYYLQITDDLPHYCTARSLLARVCNVWGLLYKGKEIVFILRVPLLVQMHVIPNGRGLHFIACTFCFLTKPTNEPGDTARQKQSSSILELATYCYNVLKKQLSPLSWHKAVCVPHELSHIQLKWWWECTTEREKLHFSWHDSLSPQSSFMYANANSKDGSVGLGWGEGGVIKSP